MSTFQGVPRVPPRGSRTLRPRGEAAPPQRFSAAQGTVDEVAVKQKEAGVLVRKNDLNGALTLFDECLVEVEETLDGLPKDDLHYMTLAQARNDLTTKIAKLKEFTPYEYYLKPVK
eukprot:TRINITY_DN11581_c0_g1_i1.p1 TRINITY_DN11581_c0_g1~~TRINITY_DN11581_c0_g1_i1.p1  ORF type:complete len:116 (-),score=22.95 TRINITY_DN11581_c0_g1_i1:271-618(-)